MNQFEKKLQAHIKVKLEESFKTDLNSITPGLKLRVYSKGRLKGSLSLGRTYRFYDLASLTKVIFTVPIVMRLSEKGIIRTDHPMAEYLPWFPSSRVKVSEILSHSGGLPWWSPFFSQLEGSMSPVYRWRQLENHLRQVQVGSRRGRAVYSDLDFLMLGMMMEYQLNLPLEQIWNEFKQSLKIPRCTLHFNSRNQPLYSRESYAPTENCPWRNKVLQGEVHDENCWSLGGVAPHAGLFGSINDVSNWALLLRKSYFQKMGSSLIGHDTLRRFCRRAIPQKKGDWSLGFMLPTKGRASCGRYFSGQSVGHTGFAGTSWWFDPRRDLIVVILSNRVHPTRENTQFVALRPLLHDWIVETLISS